MNAIWEVHFIAFLFRDKISKGSVIGLYIILKRKFVSYYIHYYRWLQRHLGGFFIKRKLDSVTGKDVLYRKVLHEVFPCMV